MDRKKLIQLIHVAKTKLGLSEDRYQAVLDGATGKGSCADMSVLELSKVLDAMKALGFNLKAGKRNPVRDGEVTGSPDRLTGRQIYYIKGLFDLACRSTSEKALRALIKRQTGVEDISFVPRAKASALIMMLRDITTKAGFDPNGPRGSNDPA